MEIALQLLIVVLDYDMEQQHFIDQVQAPDQVFEVYKLFYSLIHLLFIIILCILSFRNHYGFMHRLNN